MTQEAKSTQSAPTLLVVGAGPKAVAIAAKKHMLAKLGYPNRGGSLLQNQRSHLTRGWSHR